MMELNSEAGSHISTVCEEAATIAGEVTSCEAVIAHWKMLAKEGGVA